jgi:hypothetical protein
VFLTAVLAGTLVNAAAQAMREARMANFIVYVVWQRRIYNLRFERQNLQHSERNIKEELVILSPIKCTSIDAGTNGISIPIAP